jgi:hypothetical protein
MRQGRLKTALNETWAKRLAGQKTGWSLLLTDFVREIILKNMLTSLFHGAIIPINPIGY